ncbi:class I SAM-dependent methyltransferase [Methylacidiphilum caldifontis]|uniref:Glycosyl transferase n=1 Tax=Methylacidiphilum caldifontis TaxID=2795386 RepID=A0A4Y8PAU0_9BACT|nr:class I SAM-dependent methyltransferase [Methylacidiphilum caldifontis]TFE67577.1 glycosyl transferase [Methylacidiphilum caldifontis]
MKSESLNPFCHPILSLYPERLTADSLWHGHIPFAFWITAATQPHVFVELGVYKADSYCAFCQAVKYLHYPTACYGIDHWKGDENTPPLSKDQVEELEAYHYPRYGSFSKLLYHSFDEALEFFKDNSIDLLHLDGSSSYPSVRHNFERWLPKMSDRGVVLIHGTNAREKDFGSWLYWEEIKESYPHFHFLHGYGLGILAVGKDIHPSLKALLSLEKEQTDIVRSFFLRLGEGVVALTKNEKLRKEKESLLSRIKELEEKIQESALISLQLKEKEKEADDLSEKLHKLQEKEKEFYLDLSQLFKTAPEQSTDPLSLFNSVKEKWEEQQNLIASLNDRLSRLEKEKEELLRREEEKNKIKAHPVEKIDLQSPIKTPKANSVVQQLKVVVEKEPSSFDTSENLKKIQLNLANLEKEFHTYQNRLIEEIRRINCLDAKRLEQQCKIYKKTVKKNSFFACLFNPKAREENRLFEKVLEFNLFDPDFYILQAPDVPREEALRHYFREGCFSDLNPNPYFDTSYYLKQNPEVSQQKKNPLIHFIEEGAANRRNPSPYFDIQYYLEQYPEVAEQNLNPLSHFLIQGRKEGRLSRAILKISSRIRPGLMLKESQPTLLCPVCGKELSLISRKKSSPDQIICPHCHSKEAEEELSKTLIQYLAPQAHCLKEAAEIVQDRQLLLFGPLKSIQEVLSRSSTVHSFSDFNPQQLLAFSKDFFDFVLGLLPQHFPMKDKEPFLAIFERLKPKGKLILSFSLLNVPSEQPIKEDQTQSEPSSSVDLNWQTDLFQILKECGFNFVNPQQGVIQPPASAVIVLEKPETLSEKNHSTGSSVVAE